MIDNKTVYVKMVDGTFQPHDCFCKGTGEVFTGIGDDEIEGECICTLEGALTEDEYSEMIRESEKV